MKRRLAALLAIAALLIGPELVDPPCMEDMACWDCETMGNLICGPVTP